MIKESNPVTAKLECTSASAGGLVEINILSLWLSRSGLVLRIFISNKSPGDAGTAASIYHTLKTLHLISSQFQSDNADLSNLIQNTRCKVSARHGTTQTPHVVLKRARWLWIRTCHTITQTLKLIKTFLGVGGSRSGFFLPNDTDGLELVNFPLDLVFFILASYLNGLSSF